MNKFSLAILVLVASIAVSLNSCVRKDFDAPPDTSKIDPNLPVNMTVAQLKVRMASATLGKMIDSNWTIAGIVNADDRSGNFYKQINIADSTGGITLLIDGNSLYTRYPVGRKVYVKLQGLYYGFYNKLPQIGLQPDFTGSLSNIPFTSADNYIVRATFPNPVRVDTFTDLSQLKSVNAGMVERLVRIEGVQISAADTLKTYAQPAAITSGTSINVEDCNGNKIQMRTSGYASFQNISLPRGRGSITALYTVFGTTPQLVIRDTSDLQFYGPRCGSGTGNPGNGSLITIDSLRKLYPGSGTITLGSYKISGVVISDIDNKNVSTGNFILEDNSHKGVIMYISGSSAYKLGDSVTVDVTGATLKLYSGALEMDGVTASKVTTNATGKSIAPVTVTIAALNAAFSTYESTLVKIVAATASGGPTYGGTVTLTDASGGTLQLYTSNGATPATFASQSIQTTAKTYTGIVTPFNTTKELKIRNLTDVQ